MKNCINCKHVKINSFEFADGSRSVECLKNKKFIKFIKTLEDIEAPNWCNREPNTVEILQVKKTKRIDYVKNKRIPFDTVKKLYNRHLNGEGIRDIANSMRLTEESLRHRFNSYVRKGLLPRKVDITV